MVLFSRKSEQLLDFLAWSFLLHLSFQVYCVAQGEFRWNQCDLFSELWEKHKPYAIYINCRSPPSSPQIQQLFIAANSLSPCVLSQAACKEQPCAADHDSSRVRPCTDAKRPQSRLGAGPFRPRAPSWISCVYNFILFRKICLQQFKNLYRLFLKQS